LEKFLGPKIWGFERIEEDFFLHFLGDLIPVLKAKNYYFPDLVPVLNPQEIEEKNFKRYLYFGY
jgi:hypothetical protein